MKTSLDGENKLPEFNDWKNLLLNGLKVFITFIFYLILPPFVILFLLFLLTGGLSFFGLDILMGGSDMSMAYEGEFKDAFRFGELIEIFTDIGWLNFIKWYITTGVIFLLLFGLGTLISFIISISYGSILFYLIPLLLSLLLLPYVQMYYVRAVALVYKPE